MKENQQPPAPPAQPIDSLALYRELCDLVAEAGAVDTVIGRPEALRTRLVKMRDLVGGLTHDIAPLDAKTEAASQGGQWMQPRPPQKMRGPIARTAEAYGFVHGWNACVEAFTDFISTPTSSQLPAAQAPLTRGQINDLMSDVGWQNTAIRQADLDKVERVVRRVESHGIGTAKPEQPPAAQAPGDDSVKKAIREAYGWLWHVNNEPMAPVPTWSPEQAAYEARKCLRETLTAEERGEAINAVQRLLQNKVASIGTAKPAQPTTTTCGTCQGAGGWERANSSTSYTWVKCPACSAAQPAQGVGE